MGNKVQVTTITNVLTPSGLAAINANDQEVADEFDKVLYRDGSQTMQGSLDMDSNRIINLPTATTNSQPVTLSQLNSVVAQISVDAGAVLAAAAAIGVFPTTAAGLAAAQEGEYFYVTSAGTVVLYQDVAGVAVETARIATEAVLALTTGASLIGANDGALGSIFTTVAGFIAKLLSSTGSAIIGFIQSGTGAVARTAQAKMRDFVSVRDFGAIGDGVTDDTGAFNAAIATGRNLYVPSGTYLLGDLDDLLDSQIIQGEGMFQNGSSSTVLKYSGSGTFITFSSRNVLRYLQILGPATDLITYAGAAGVGVHSFGGYHRIEHCFIRGFAEGVRIDSANNCIYTGVTIDFNIRGVTFNSTIENTTQTFVGCNIRMSQKEGVKGTVVTVRNIAISFIGGAVEDNAQDGTTPQFHMGDVGQLTFKGVYFEDNKATKSDTINLTGAGQVSVSACYFNSGNRHIYATAAVDYSSIHECRFLGTVATNAVELNAVGCTNTYLYSNEHDKPTLIAGATSTVITGAIADLKVDEASWTPALAGTSGGAPTHSVQVGRYTRIGNRVFFDARVSISAKGTMAGNLRLTGLPIARSVVGGMDVQVAVSYDGLTFTGGRTDLVGVIPSGASAVTFLQQGSGLGQVEQDVANTANATTIEISGSYAV